MIAKAEETFQFDTIDDVVSDIAKGRMLLREAGGVEKVTMETNGWLLGLFAKEVNCASTASPASAR